VFAGHMADCSKFADRQSSCVDALSELTVVYSCMGGLCIDRTSKNVGWGVMVTDVNGRAGIN